MSDMWPWQPAPTEKPMSSLDERLREIIKGVVPDVDDGTNAAMLDRVVAEIKKAAGLE